MKGLGSALAAIIGDEAGVWQADAFVFARAAAARSAVEAATVDGYVSGTGAMGVVSDFNIEIVFEGDWTDDLQQAFIIAAEYLSTVITGGLPDQGAIDDVRITATLSDIDGAGGVLGAAGPTAVRPDSQLPSAGEMEFDLADAVDLDAEGLFDDVVVHEMMHVLGFGTTWRADGLVEGTVRDGDIRFVGENAEIAYRYAFPKIYARDDDRRDGVPVETDGGAGTQGGHWDDDTFEDEIMTGYIDDSNEISPMTIAALEDMGYRTVFEADAALAALPTLDDVLAFA